jgi:hypothetical protein
LYARWKLHHLMAPRYFYVVPVLAPWSPGTGAGTGKSADRGPVRDSAANWIYVSFTFFRTLTLHPSILDTGTYLYAEQYPRCPLQCRYKVLAPNCVSGSNWLKDRFERTICRTCIVI